MVVSKLMCVSGKNYREVSKDIAARLGVLFFDGERRVLRSRDKDAAKRDAGC